MNWQKYIYLTIKEKYKIKYSKIIRKIKLRARLELYRLGIPLSEKNHFDIPYFIFLNDKDWKLFESILINKGDEDIINSLSKTTTISVKYCSAPLAERLRELLANYPLSNAPHYFLPGIREYLENLSSCTPPVRNRQEFEKRLIFNLQMPLARKEDILLIPYWGPGDEVLPAAALQFIEDMAGENGNIHVLCDHRLHDLFSRSFKKIHFISSRRKRYASFSDYRHFRELPEFDYHTIFCNDSYHAANKIRYWASIYLAPLHYLEEMQNWAGGNFLQPDQKLVSSYAQHMNAPSLKVGICWRSTLLTHKRLGYWHIDDLREILNIQGIQFYIYQHGMSSHERNTVRKHGCIELEGLDLFNDFEGLAASMANLDLFIGPSTFNTWLAAAVGCPTIMLDSAMLRTPAFRGSHCFWNKAIRILHVDSNCQKKPVLHELAQELNRLVAK